jgi:hypothetical protein
MRSTFVTVVAIVALTALTGACDDGEPEAQKSPTPSPTVTQETSQEALRQGLLAPADLAPGLEEQTIDFQQGRSFGTPQQPLKDVIFSPPECALVGESTLGDLSKARGWIRTFARPIAAKPAPGASDAFARSQANQTVITIPGGLDLARVREAVAKCTQGKVTLRAFNATGQIRLTEAAAPNIAAAQQTLAVHKDAEFAGLPARAQGFASSFNGDLVLTVKGDVVTMVTTPAGAPVRAQDLAAKAFEQVNSATTGG